MGTAPPMGVHDPHDELWRGGYSPKAMIGPIAGAAFITIAAFIGALIFSKAVVAYALLAIVFLAWLGVLMVFATRRLGVHYRLTTQRFFRERGILRRVTDRVEVIAIDDITVEQGPIERLLGIGTIKMASNDHTDPVFVLDGIEDVQQVADIIDEARRAERNRRSVRMESI
jgi:membrane protein YdbS with pleckstrin-like domain